MLRKLIRKHMVLRKTLRNNYGNIIYYSHTPDRKSVYEKMLTIKDEHLLMTNPESYLLYRLAMNSTKVPGDMAEVGVYMGRSAKLMLDATGYKKQIHLFDTFEGLPDPTVEDMKEHSLKKGEYYAAKEPVEQYLHDHSSITHFYKGRFPETAGPIKDKRFSFVNIDVDLYQGTRDALEFFYPRMNKGGIIISHDYAMEGGVRDSIIEFFSDKEEPILEAGVGSQGFIVKI